ncbi:hypothetical protein BS50DRAFT_283095 [Corynespora cassiicola Philippines]|uniref:Uncharacterized protein n=1 Tax=Corynespora cassiicola Philippines TaxID=1448308 RepID=A0A2T2P1A1_CORCC|nr:hypothetical protein BS50DRAFT_283095 [Corynespora cassiicola Philippines]
MVPANTQLPLIPVTDLELVIYFYNLVSRPMVALRLYARGWGPARITNALNKYRKPDPPYLRNTCTVKCNTAFRRGKEMYGEDWHEANHEKFQHVDDCDATDILYDSIKGNDLCDPDLLEVANGLVEYPDDVELGPLTKCIRYCVENGIHCPVSRAHELAMGLEGGEMPEEFLVKVKTEFDHE